MSRLAQYCACNRLASAEEPGVQGSKVPQAGPEPRASIADASISRTSPLIRAGTVALVTLGDWGAGRLTKLTTNHHRIPEGF